MRSLNRFLKLRSLLIGAKRLYFTKIWGMDIHPTAKFSLNAWFDRTYPKGVHIGAETLVAFGATILTHDMTRGLYAHTRIGRRCFIGARSIILPGVSVGDECLVGAGSVVTRDVPPRSIVAGNPARIIRSGVPLEPYGNLPTAHAARLKAAEDGLFD